MRSNAWRAMHALVQRMEVDAARGAEVAEGMRAMKTVFDSMRSADLDGLSPRVRANIERAVSRGPSAAASLPPSIGIVTIWANRHTELTLFVLPPRTRLPLHAHRHLNVACKVIAGTLHHFAADFADTEGGSQASPVPVATASASPPEYDIRCVSSGALTEESAAMLIDAKSGPGVLHEFWTCAASGAVFLDCFSPRYDGPPHFSQCEYFAFDRLEEILRGASPPSAGSSVRVRQIDEPRCVQEMIDLSRASE